MDSSVLPKCIVAKDCIAFKANSGNPATISEHTVNYKIMFLEQGKFCVVIYMTRTLFMKWDCTGCGVCVEAVLYLG